MPFISEMIEDANVHHENSQLNLGSDPIFALYLLLAFFVAYIFRGIIFISLIFLVKLSLLAFFGLITYRYFVI